MPRFNIGDKVRCYGREWTIVSDHASIIGRTMTPEMAASRVKDGLEHLPNGRAVYLDDEDVARLDFMLARWVPENGSDDVALARIIARAKGDDAHEGQTRSAEERVGATSSTSSSGAQ